MELSIRINNEVSNKCIELFDKNLALWKKAKVFSKDNAKYSLRTTYYLAVSKRLGAENEQLLEEWKAKLGGKRL